MTPERGAPRRTFPGAGRGAAWRRLPEVLGLLPLALGLLLVVGAAPALAGDGAPLPPSESTPAEVREQADEILSRSEFDEPEPSLVDRVFGWIGDRLSDLLGGIGLGGAGGQSVLGWIVLAVMAGLVAWLVVRLVRGGRLGRRAAQEEAADVVVAETSTDWLAAAEAEEAEGRWRSGLRCRYRALVGELVDRGVLDAQPGRTSGEHRREVVERAPDAASAFSGAADLFDRAWYGNRPTGADESARFQALAAEVRDRAGRTDRRAVDELDLLVAPR